MIDISLLTDRVLLFDSLLADEPVHHNDGNVINAPDFVVDVETGALNQFFQIFDDIGFDREVNRLQLDVQIWFILSWTLKSMRTVENIQALVSGCKLKIARNMADKGELFALKPEEENLLHSVETDLLLNALSSAAMRVVNDRRFSFGDFVVGKHHNINDQVATEISTFIKLFYDQIF